MPPFVVGEVAIGIERMSNMLSELAPLHAMHYEETEKTYLDSDYEPQYDQYQALERDRKFVCFTVRIGLQMVGYLQYYVFRDMHSRHVYQAREDALFIHPMVRGRKLAPQLIAYAEDALRALGCRYVGMTSKAPVGAPDIGPKLEQNGYRAVATYYVKDLES